MTYYNQELYHHGILGQKWGIRRFQNPDGTLTEEGRLRYKQDANGKLVKLSKAEKAKVAQEIASQKEKNKPLKEKRISSMSDEELNTYINRMSSEKRAYELKRDVTNLTPKKKSLVEDLVNKFGNQLVTDTSRELTSLGKKYLEQELGLQKPESETDRLKRESIEWTNKANIVAQQNRYDEEMKKRNKEKSGT